MLWPSVTGGDAFGGRAFGFPQHFAGERVEAGDEFAAGEEELVAAVHVEDDGRGVVGEFRALVLPDHFAGGALESGDLAGAFVVGGDDHERLINGRGRGESLVQNVVGDLGLPELLAVAAQGRGVNRAVVEEVDEDASAVARGGRGGEGTLVIALGKRTAMHLGLPDFLAR